MNVELFKAIAELDEKSLNNIRSPTLNSRLENVVLDGSEECKMEEDHQNQKNVDRYICYNAYMFLPMR